MPDCLPDIDALLMEAVSGTIEIVTSTLSAVEVAYGESERQGKAPDLELDEMIASLWGPVSPVRLVEFYGLIGADARALIRDAMVRGWALKAMDAIHLATARRLDAAEFHTYGQKLYKFGDLLGVKVGPPLATQLTLPPAET